MTYQKILKSVGYPTDVLVIDFETYFDADYTLSKMSTIEYIMDKRFEFTGVGVAESMDFFPRFCPKKQEGITVIYDFIACMQNVYGQNFEKITVVAKNCKFDITILATKFGIMPPYIIDIDDLLRHYDSRMSHKMKDVTSMFGLQSKGDTLQFKGLHYKEMDAETKANLAKYCIGDIEIEADLFRILLPKISNPVVEIPIARHTLGLYLHPRFTFHFEQAEELRVKMKLELLKTMEKVDWVRDYA